MQRPERWTVLYRQAANNVGGFGMGDPMPPHTVIEVQAMDVYMYVIVYGDGSSFPQVVEDFELVDSDHLRNIGLSQPLPGSVKHVKMQLKDAVYRLNESGSTALGPAALISIALASQRPGSKVIICTDGKANTDLGNLEDVSSEELAASKQFYNQLAEYARQQGYFKHEDNEDSTLFRTVGNVTRDTEITFEFGTAEEMYKDISVSLLSVIVTFCGIVLLGVSLFVSWKLCWIPWRDKEGSGSSTGVGLLGGGPGGVAGPLPQLLQRKDQHSSSSLYHSPHPPHPHFSEILVVERVELGGQSEMPEHSYLDMDSYPPGHQTTTASSGVVGGVSGMGGPLKMSQTSPELPPSSESLVSASQNRDLPNAHSQHQVAVRTEQLVVKILKALDLPAKDANGFSDPYVKIYLLPDRKKKFQTKVHRKTLNPVFNETFHFGVPFAELQNRKLHFSVYDFDRFSRHDLIGQVVVDNLLDFSENPDEKPVWRDIVEATAVTGRLTVTIIKATNLKAMDLTGFSDPYVKASLICDGRRLKKRKTSIKKNTLNPVYNEALVFDIPNENIDHVSLVIAVMDYDCIGHNEVIGMCRVGHDADSPGRDHWVGMLANPRKPIEHWHQLVECLLHRFPKVQATLSVTVPLSTASSPVSSSVLFHPTSTNDRREAAPYMGTRMGSSCFLELPLGHTPVWRKCWLCTRKPSGCLLSSCPQHFLVWRKCWAPGFLRHLGAAWRWLRAPTGLGFQALYLWPPIQPGRPPPCGLEEAQALLWSSWASQPGPTRDIPAPGRRLTVATGPYRGGLPSPVPEAPNITRTDTPSRSGGGTSPPLVLLGIGRGPQHAII
ncbi:SY63 protein, partial [Polypterus senegalus]